MTSDESKPQEEVISKLYERYDLALRRIGQSPGATRSYWSGESTGLQYAIELLGGTVDGR